MFSGSELSHAQPSWFNNIFQIDNFTHFFLQFMAVYSYKPSQHSPNDYPTYELSFEEGDIIRVYGQMRADGFYHGKVCLWLCASQYLYFFSAI